jgi:hypothetical protein
MGFSRTSSDVDLSTKVTAAGKQILHNCVHGECIGELTTLSSNAKETNFAIPMTEGFLDK